mgnify:CR=1 FL=1
MVVIYTDGSCLGNPGPGGWAFYCLETGEQKSGEALKIDEVHAVVTDSIYCKNGIEKWMYNWKNNGWKTSAGKPVKNVDLWKQISELYKDVAFRWVKAHSTNKYNAIADKNAREEALKIKNSKKV